MLGCPLGCGATPPSLRMSSPTSAHRGQQLCLHGVDPPSWSWRIGERVIPEAAWANHMSCPAFCIGTEMVRQSCCAAGTLGRWWQPLLREYQRTYCSQMMIRADDLHKAEMRGSESLPMPFQLLVSGFPEVQPPPLSSILWKILFSLLFPLFYDKTNSS